MQHKSKIYKNAGLKYFKLIAKWHYGVLFHLLINDRLNILQWNFHQKHCCSWEFVFFPYLLLYFWKQNSWSISQNQDKTFEQITI